MKTKTNLNPRRTPIPSVSTKEPNVSFDKSKQKHDVLSLSTSINGELERFRVTNRDNDHDNDGNNQDNGEHWKPNKIIEHKKLDRFHNSYNVIIAWENGEISEILLTMFDQDEPNECAQYAKEKHLLDEPGWERYRDNHEYYQPRNGFNDNEGMDNNDEQQSEGGINTNNDEFLDNNNEHINSDIKANNYCETVEQM